MSTVLKSFTAIGAGAVFLARKGERFSYSVSGSFDATIVLERSVTGGQTWETVITATGSASGTEKAYQEALYRFRCTVFDSGTAETSIADVVDTLQKWQNKDGETVFKITEDGIETPKITTKPKTIIVPAGVLGKVGATAGWLVAASDDVNLATLPAEETGSTLVIPIPGLKVGDTITDYYLIGQIESAAGTVTLDADLRKQTAIAADVSDASIGAMTQISVDEDTAITSANSTKTLDTPEVIGANETFYVVLTGTTAASTDIALQAVAITVMETQ